ncbi:MAG: Fe-S protein radical family [Cyanobacteria bacterium RYN_339]|nr:Fe-S protein radical family [Cyanobacteria bacterium RYN_339]
MTDRVRPYMFYDIAVSICSTCYRKVEGKILFEDDKVYLTKRCPQHGAEKVLMADDVDYYRRSREVFLKKPEMPARYNTPVLYGCPYDCGLCGDHEQHSCLSIIEIADFCNLSCPICYAESGPTRQQFRTLAEIEFMLDAVVKNELEPDVVQISGGEPTMHPDFFAVLDLAKQRPIKHLMVNTNGLRIAKDEAFVERLATYMPGFELYLQFDSFKEEALVELRGKDLREVRMQALEKLNRHGISTTLVVTLKKGLNDDEIGKIIEFALQQPCVRGVTLQPIQAAGRLEGYDPATDRLTLTEVRRRILEQTDIFRPEDIIPVPCHPDSLAMAYALKLGGSVTPLTGMIDPQLLIDGGRNTIIYEKDNVLREQLFKLFSTNHSPDSGAASLRDLLCCLPQAEVTPGIGYENLFRVLIVQFIDAQSFDLRSVKKTCVHIVHPDGRLIPFDTYNMFYRDDLEETRLKPLRDEILPALAGRKAKHLTGEDQVRVAADGAAVEGVDLGPALLVAELGAGDGA